MTRYWIAVACADHVRRGQADGFMQVCHGRLSQLNRVKPNDWVVYYSPTVTFGGKDKLQAFTAFGKVTDREPYQVEMGNAFHPFRRDVDWTPCNAASIRPLLQELELTKDKKRWASSFRFGLVAIGQHDMQLIAQAMRSSM